MSSIAGEIAHFPLAAQFPVIALQKHKHLGCMWGRGNGGLTNSRTVQFCKKFCKATPDRNCENWYRHPAFRQYVLLAPYIWEQHHIILILENYALEQVISTDQ